MEKDEDYTKAVDKRDSCIAVGSYTGMHEEDQKRNMDVGVGTSDSYPREEVVRGMQGQGNGDEVHDPKTLGPRTHLPKP